MKAFVFILPLLGFTWLVGLLAVNEGSLIFAFVFVILNSLQVCMNMYIRLCMSICICVCARACVVCIRVLMCTYIHGSRLVATSKD